MREEVSYQSKEEGKDPGADQRERVGDWGDRKRRGEGNGLLVGMDLVGRSRGRSEGWIPVRLVDLSSVFL